MTQHLLKRRDRRTRRTQRGLTLIEACAVMAVTAVLASTAAPGMQGLIDSRRLDGTAAQLATDVQFVRTEAVSRNLPLRLSFHATSSGSCYVIHSGSANQCDCVAEGPAICRGDAVSIRTVRLADADRVALQANVGSLLFDPQHGTVSPTGTLRVIGGNGRAVHQIVNIMGRVRSCSPGALMPAYHAC
jgi:type IV fimbrial biogenesis protein FimT